MNSFELIEVPVWSAEDLEQFNQIADRLKFCKIAEKKGVIKEAESLYRKLGPIVEFKLLPAPQKGSKQKTLPYLVASWGRKDQLLTKVFLFDLGESPEVLCMVCAILGVTLPPSLVLGWKYNKALIFQRA